MTKPRKNRKHLQTLNLKCEGSLPNILVTQKNKERSHLLSFALQSDPKERKNKKRTHATGKESNQTSQTYKTSFFFCFP
jgi:hypothetical protein